MAASFSTATTAHAATSYSTPVSITGDPDTTNYQDVSIGWLSLASSVNPNDVDQLTTYNGNTYDYLYSAYVDFPFTLTVPYADYSTFLFYNTFQCTPSFGTNNRIIGYEYEILNGDENLQFQIRTVNTSGRIYVSVRAQDYNFTQSKQVSWILRVKIYFDRTSGIYETVPSSVGSAELSSRSTYISGGAYSHGNQYTRSIYQMISDAIETSPTLLDSLALLDAISDDTELLSSVLAAQQSLNTQFAQFYNDLAAYNATGSQNTGNLQYFDSVRVYLQRLQAALTGWSSNTSTTPSALATLTFDRWVSIIETALNNQAPDVTQAQEQQQNAQQLSDSQHVQESAVFESAGSAMSDVDLNWSIPGSVVSTAVTLMSMIGMIWDRLGDFQFIGIAVLTCGIIVVLLGVINRFPRHSSNVSPGSPSLPRKHGMKVSSAEDIDNNLWRAGL